MKNAIQTNRFLGRVISTVAAAIIAAFCLCGQRTGAQSCPATASITQYPQVLYSTFNNYWDSSGKVPPNTVTASCCGGFYVVLAGGGCGVTNAVCTPTYSTDPGSTNGGYIVVTNYTPFVSVEGGVTNIDILTSYFFYGFTSNMTLNITNTVTGVCTDDASDVNAIVVASIQIINCAPGGGCGGSGGTCALNSTSPNISGRQASPSPGTFVPSLNKGLDFSVNLGSASTLDDGGIVWLHAAGPSTSLATPAALQVPYARPNVTVITNSGTGVIEQVDSPLALVNVATSNAYEYQLQVFYSNSVTSFDGTNFLTGTNTPFVTYDIKNPDTNTASNRLWIAEVRGSVTNQYQYTYTNDTSQSTRWDMLRPDGTTVSQWFVTNSTNVNITNYYWQMSVGTNILQQSCSTVQFVANNFPFITNSIVEGAGSVTQTTTLTYYPTNAAVGSSNRLQRVDYPNGNWVYYLYDTNGLVTNEFSAWGNSTPPSDPTQQPSVVSNLCKLTTYDYTPVATNLEDDGSQPFLARTTTVVLPVLVGGSWQAQEVSRSYRSVANGFAIPGGGNTGPRIQDQQCVLPEAPWEDTSTVTSGTSFKTKTNLNTITLTYSADSDSPLAGRPYAVYHTDGTVTLYSYSQTDTDFTTVESTGDPGAGNWGWYPGHWSPTSWQLVSGTITTTVADALGRLESRTVVDVVSGATLADDEYAYDSGDPSGRNYTLTDLAGRNTMYEYACCGLESVTDPDGVVTSYNYDSLKRPVATMVTRGNITNSVTTSNTLDVLGRVLESQRTGTNSSVITLSQNQYDVLGRTTSQINALSGTTSIVNATTNSQQCVTSTYPDGGTRIDLYYRDGSLESVTGTAVQPVKYTNFVVSDGGYYRQVRQTIKLDTNGSDTSEWTETFMDGAGESYETAFADASTPPTALSYYNNYGQLWKQVDPDRIINLFTYNGRGQREYSLTALSSTATNETSYSSLLSDLSSLLGGNDRISYMVYDVITTNTDVAIRTQTYAWKTNSSSTSTLLSTMLADPNGLGSTNVLWNNGQGVTNWSRTVYAGSGYRYTTNMAPDGSYTVSTYLYGQLQSVTRKDTGNNQVTQTSYGYDPHWRQNTVTDARTGTTTSYFNNLDQVSGIVTPSPTEVTTNSFDNLGRITNSTLPDSTSVTTVYYPTGQIQMTSGSRTYPVGYSYDAQGRMKTMSNWASFPSGTARVTTWNYDAYRGFLTGKTYGGSVAGPAYAYTGAGRLLERFWARGTNTVYSYDQAGDLASVAYSDSTSSVINGYDRLGRLTTVSNASIVCALAYNDAGNVTGESYSGGIMDKISITNVYDQYLRRMTNATLYNGSVLTTITNNYDTASRLSVIGDGTNSGTYSYLANSSLVSNIVFKQSGSPRMTTTKTYDNLNRLTLISSTTNSVVVDQHGYAYNSANQRTTVTNTDSSYWQYGYDSLGQVTSGKKYWSDGTPVAGEQFGYGFDNIGNRTSTQAGGNDRGEGLRNASYTANNLNQYTSRTVPGAVDIIGTALSTATVTVNGQPTYRHSDYFRDQLGIDNSDGPVWQAVTNLGVVAGTTNTVSNFTGNIFLPQNPETFGYDADGNLTNDGRWSYVWDAENRLVNQTSQSGAPTNSKFKLDFAYDYKGRRIQKLVSTNNGSYVAQYTNRFVYDGWNLANELNGANDSIIRAYVWGLDLSGSLQGAGGVGGLLAEISPSSSEFVCFDGNGNVAALTDTTTSAIVAQYENGPFGEVIRATGPMAKVNPFRFSTKYQDDETDLVYYGYRYYNPSTGRWPSRDPVEEEGGLNLYAFCAADGINGIDVLGLSDFNAPPTIVNPPQPTPNPNAGYIWTKWGMEWMSINGFGYYVAGNNSVSVELKGKKSCGCLDPSSIAVDETITKRLGWSETDRQKTIVISTCGTGRYNCYTYTRSVWWSSALINKPSWLEWLDSKYLYHQYIEVSVTICADGSTSHSASYSQSGGWPWNPNSDAAKRWEPYESPYSF